MTSRKISATVAAGLLLVAPAMMALTPAAGAQPARGGSEQRGAHGNPPISSNPPHSASPEQSKKSDAPEKNNAQEKNNGSQNMGNAKPERGGATEQSGNGPLTRLRSPKNLSVSDVTTSGATLAWSAVAGATGYRVRLYLAEGQATAESLVDAEETTIEFAELDGSTEYRASVQALGDGVTSRDSTASGKISFTTTGSLTYQIGDVGPGGGIVFYASATPFTSTGSACNTACHYLEFAPKGWASTTAVPEDVTYNGQVIRTRTNADEDPILVWSDGAFMNDTNGTLARGTAIGTGMGNTLDMAANTSTTGKGMRFGFQAALAYAGSASAGEWFLPSIDELNELCKFVLGQTADLGTSVQCHAATSAVNSAYGFTIGDQLYWSSSYPFLEGVGRNPAWGQSPGYMFTGNSFYNGAHIAGSVYNGYYSSYGEAVRPIRAFG